MKTLLILLLSLGCFTIVLQEKASKVQPKDMLLAKDSQSDKYGEVPFNHENHATKKYSPDGQSVLTCVECHHTDQPAANLKAPLKTSEREVVLTGENLAAADAKPVKSCRVCHLQAGDDSAPMPSVQYGQASADKANQRSRVSPELQPLSRQSYRRASGAQRESTRFKQLPAVSQTRGLRSNKPKLRGYCCASIRVRTVETRAHICQTNTIAASTVPYPIDRTSCRRWSPSHATPAPDS